AYARQWLDRRKERYEATRKRFEATGVGKIEHRDWATDESRMRRHVFPSALGSMLVEDVRARHLKAFVHDLRTAGDLSTHSIANVYGLIVSLFEHATIDGIIEGNSP